MNPDWLSFLTAQGARIEASEIHDFGNAGDELQASRSGTVISPLTQYGLIRASGEDAAPFLHNLLSNDIQHLGPQHAVRASFCSPKGRILADFLVWREGTDYLLQLSADIHPAILKKLGMYVLRSKVKLSDAGDDLVLIGVSGSGVSSALRALGSDDPAHAMDLVRFDAGAAIRLDDRRCQLAVRGGMATQVWSTLLAAQLLPVGSPAWRWLEIGAGIPHITQATQEEFVPQMANLDLIGGVSFSKGCYPGQEVVARTKYLGKVKRRTYRARIDGSCPTPGTDLYSPDLPEQSCGKVIQAAPGPAGGCELLASMLMSSAEGGEVRVGSGTGPRLEFLPLPYSLE